MSNTATARKLLRASGMAHKVDELPVFSHAQEFTIAVTAILEASTLRRNSKQYEQIAEASESVLANMDEGFDQESDDAFARFLYYSKGSIAEVMRRLRRASMTGQVPAAAVAALDPKAEELGRMIGGFIKYLRQSGFRDRGRFRASQLRRE
jgi:four helix bundle protein